MKKLLHVIDSLGVGGAEHLLVNVINSLYGYEHHLVVLNEPLDLRSRISRDCRFTNLGCKSKLSIIRSVARLKRYIRENRIDIVHSHLYTSNIISRLATPAGIPVFNSIHAISSLASYKVRKISLYAERITYKQRHHIIAVSNAVLEDFKKWVGLKGKHTVLYNFVDEKYFNAKKGNSKTHEGLNLVAVGNLRWQKNYEYLLEAFKELPANVRLDIYGQGNLEDKFTGYINAHKLNIQLKGTRSDLEKILPGYDAFVMSSFYEGQPLSMLEATACGLPSLLSDIPVLREVLGDDALYFNINETAGFTGLVNSILNKKYDLEKIAGNAYQRVNEFAHIGQYLEKLTRLYEQESRN